MAELTVEGKHQLIYATVVRIPRGKVASYGQVALHAGLPGHARLAGYALFNMPAALFNKVPWWRVIYAGGRISYSEARLGHDLLQRELLEKEGVQFDARGRVSFAEFGWKPKDP
jgi:methylated-DNA-protein-cysteine methyltransferase-like protein